MQPKIIDKLVRHKRKNPSLLAGVFAIGCLAVTYSRMAGATLPSAQLRFTSEFGMESGGSTTLLPPGKTVTIWDENFYCNLYITCWVSSAPSNSWGLYG